MLISDTRTQFGLVAILLHWIIGLSWFGLFALGWYMVELDYYDPLYRTLPYWHKSVGMLLCLVVGVRLIFRLLVKRPEPAGNPSKLEALSAEIAHRLLMLGVIALLVTGYLIPTAEGDGIDVFGWVTVPALISDYPDQEDIAGEFHEIVAYMMLALIALHMLAALKHQIIDRNGALVRMIYPVSDKDESDVVQ
ncbi:MAG: cytochrome b [Pseudomonadales bacterium]|nr:cytochrome b [Pseudomonadales bacterium]